VIVGLPDTIWFPVDALRALDGRGLSFLLFPVDRPDLFDSVITDEEGSVLEIDVKKPDTQSNWIWGAFRLTGQILRDLHALWRGRDPHDEYIGTLVNAYLASGGVATGIRAGESYVDVGTPHGFREATQLLDRRQAVPRAALAEPLL